jgi:hypothetical protein
MATGSPANTIVNIEASLPDGSVAAYRDADPSHVRRGVWQAIMASHPLRLAVTTLDGTVFAVDLITGALSAGEHTFTPEPIPPAPLKPIYYKRMEGGDDGRAPAMVFFVVGFEARLDVRNVKVGMKIYPAELRWEISEDI